MADAVQHEDRNAAAESPCILVVDDADVARRFMTQALRKEGYRVSEARDGADALEQLEADCPDLLITDSTMPGIDGTTLIAEARARYPTLPILRVSGSHGLSGIRAILPPDVPTLDKPFGYDALLTAVAALLDRKRR